MITEVGIASPSLHPYENVLLDFVLSDRICAPNGYIVLDDMWMPSIQKVVKFVERNRADYARRKSPVENFVVFQKIGKEQRPWNHFVDF